MKDTELAYFLPSSWTNILHNAPLLGGNSVIIDLDKSFVEYLESDGIFLEKLLCATSSSKFSDSEDYSSESDFEQGHLVPSQIFTEIHEIIVKKIAFLGGCVVPKLNWTVPLDSIWISANTLKCTSASEVYQLLKSSDRIQSDLALFSHNNFTPQLFLRPFCDLLIENEFRCFVMNKKLIAVSQRNLEIFSEFICLKSNDVLDLISNFFSIFISDFPVQNYSFDVYIDKNYSKVYLVDINPLTNSTLTGLYEFSDLMNFSSRNSDKIEFRCIRDNNSTRIGLCEKNFLPVDLLNLRSDVNDIDFNNLHP